MLAPVVVLAVLVTVIWTVTAAGSSDDSIDTGDAPAKRLAWTADLDVGAPSKEAISAGVWFGRDVVARGDGSGLRAYDLATGKQRWRLRAPARRGCAMSATIKDGIGYVLAPKGWRCTELYAIQVRTGKVLARTHLSFGLDSGHPDRRLWLAGGGIIGVAGNDVVSLAPAHPAKPRWRATAAPKGCSVDEIRAKGKLLLVMTHCPADSSTTLTAYDTDTGTPRWRTSVHAGYEFASLLSASPPVATVGDDGDKAPMVVGYDPRTGQQRMHFRAETHDGARLVPNPDNVVFSGHTMVLGGAGVAAYDVRTGDRLWSKHRDLVDFIVLHQKPGKRVYAVGAATDGDEHADALVSFGARSGEMRVAARLAPVTEDFPNAASLTWTGERIVAAHVEAVSESDYRTLEVYA